MEEKELEIILASSAVFMQYGIKSVNMDDIAKHLSISKKTLYKYVKDKNDLLSKAMKLHMAAEDSAISEIMAKDLNAIDENLEIMNFILSMLQNLHPSIIFDLEKYHPSLMKEMLDSRHKSMHDCVLSNLKKGKKEGLYRKNLNEEILTSFYINSIDVILDVTPVHIQGASFTERYSEFFRYHIRGIASQKGVDYLKTKVKL